MVSTYDTIHVRYVDAWSSAEDEVFRRQQRHAVLNSDAVLCISETTRQNLVERCGADPARLHVVHLGRDPVFARREVPDARRAALGVEAPFVLYVGGREITYERFATLLGAHAGWSRRDEIGLVVVGPPWHADGVAVLHRLGLDGRVRILANIDDDALADVYSTAEAFVYPSLYERFGIPLLEAMACGCPLVASRIPTTEEVAAEVPFYFEPGGGDGLVDALDRALAEGRRGPHSARGVARADVFSWD